MVSEHQHHICFQAYLAYLNCKHFVWPNEMTNMALIQSQFWVVLMIKSFTHEGEVFLKKLVTKNKITHICLSYGKKGNMASWDVNQQLRTEITQFAILPSCFLFFHLPKVKSLHQFCLI
jgi:hypothetical protein